MLRVDPVERYETHCGCLVETQRHAYSDGTTIEHVTLSTPDPDHQPTEGDDHDDSDCP